MLRKLKTCSLVAWGLVFALAFAACGGADANPPPSNKSVLDASTVDAGSDALVIDDAADDAKPDAAGDAANPEAGAPDATVAETCAGVRDFSTAAAGTQAKVPAEYIARTFLDAYGRIPDQPTWNAAIAYFQAHKCGVPTLRVMTDFYKSKEFLALPYTHRERVLALYLGALGREPDASGFNHYVQQLDSGAIDWCSVVDEVEVSAEYAAHAATICSPTKTNYHYESAAAPIAIMTSITSASLNAQLAAAKPGQTVTIPEATLVITDATIVVPKGVTLATSGVTGLAGRESYARMARLVRHSAFSGPVVELEPGARLRNVWVSGRHGALNKSANSYNVFTVAAPTKATSIEWVRSDNPIAGQNFRFDGSTTKDGCAAGTTANENLIFNGANDNHLPGAQWADGVFTLCENAHITNNEVVDASDVALIAFFSLNQTPQHSLFQHNRVLSAGNDTFGGLVTDPFKSESKLGCTAGVCDFTGTRFDSNVLFSGPNTHYVIGISAGTRAWSFISPHGQAKGATWTNTTSGSSRVRVQIAIYVSGMSNATLTGNWNPNLIDYVHTPSTPANSCGIGAALANFAHASGSLQGAVQADRDNCI